MVAVLWREERRAAAIRLEQLWNELGARVPFSLLCAYPIQAFRKGDDDGPFLEVCGEHARVIPADRPDDLERILSAIRRGERVEHFETERIRKDGERIRVSLTVSPIRDASGRIIGASKIARDVTERARAEHALRETSDIL